MPSKTSKISFDDQERAGLLHIVESALLNVVKSQLTLDQPELRVMNVVTEVSLVWIGAGNAETRSRVTATRRGG
jgi:hypothetical protein